MSSYSEYLNRMKQRLPNIVDTRPHRDASHQTGDANTLVLLRISPLIEKRASIAMRHKAAMA